MESALMDQVQEDDSATIAPGGGGRGRPQGRRKQQAWRLSSKQTYSRGCRLDQRKILQTTKPLLITFVGETQNAL